MSTNNNAAISNTNISYLAEFINRGPEVAVRLKHLFNFVVESSHLSREGVELRLPLVEGHSVLVSNNSLTYAPPEHSTTETHSWAEVLQLVKEAN